jgi:hypothetical protein
MVALLLLYPNKNLLVVDVTWERSTQKLQKKNADRIEEIENILTVYTEEIRDYYRDQA